MNKKELEKQIKKIIGEVDKLTKDVLKEEEISAYKSYLLDIKLHILEGHYDELVKEIRNILKSEDKKYDILNILVLLGIILSFIIAFINPYIFLLLVYITTYGCRRLNTINDDRKNETKNFESEVSDLKSIFQDSYTMLKTKSNIFKDSDRDSLDSEELKNITLANKYIDMVLNGEAIPSISPVIEATVIKLLQSDLGTNENNIEKLLMMAHDKTISEMVRLGDFSLKRTNSCNLE